MKQNVKGAAFTVIASAIAQIGYSADTTVVMNQSTEATGIDEVVVTARRRSEVLKDVPMAIDVASGVQIEKLSLLSFQDLQQLSPGLILDASNNTASLRGVTYNTLTSATASVDVYFNEAPVDSSTAFTAIYDLEQIEVLRGPQGVLRGRTSPSGAITMRTRQPDFSEFTGYLQATGTNKDSQNLQAAFSVPLIKDQLALRVAALNDRNRGNGIYNVNRQEYSKKDTDSIRVSLGWKPTSTINATLTHQYLHQLGRSYGAVVGSGNQPSLMSPARSGPSATVEDRIAVTEGADRAEKKIDMTTLNADWDLGSHTLSFVGMRQSQRYSNASDRDQANAVPNWIGAQNQPANKIDTYSLEGRLSSNGEGFFNYTVGAYYAKYKVFVGFNADNTQLFSSPATPLLPSIASLPTNARIDIPLQTIDKSLFGSASFKLSDNLKLDAGLRHTQYSLEKQSSLTVTTPGGIGFLAAVPPRTLVPRTDTIPPYASDYDTSATTGSLSLSYKWNDEVTSYASYGRSYRNGTPQVGVRFPLDPSIMVTKPEESDAIEIGLKSSLFDRKLAINVAAFTQRYKGYIDVISVPVASARNGIIDNNAQLLNYNGDVASRGLEFQITAKPTTSWDIGTGFSWVDSHFDNAEVPCVLFNSNGTQMVPVGQQFGTCQSSRSVSNSSKWNLTANSEYRWRMGSLQPFVRGLFTYRPSFYSEATNTQFERLANLNLFMGARDIQSGWTLTLFVKNLFNTSRIVPQAPRTDGQSGIAQLNTAPLGGAFQPVPYISGYRQVEINPPREVGVTLQYDF